MLRIAFLSRTPLPFPAVHATATLLTLLSLTAPAAAGPVDPVVRNGVATFAVNGNVFTVTNTPGAIIDWRQFNVANGELLRFLQLNAQSTVLNRVTGSDPSQILGALQSNGRVLLVNPNGVLFGANAMVDVAGLVVSGLRLSDADFLAGKYNFAGGNGAVSNLGSITTPLGGSVYLIGGDVANSGVIRAPGGQILLAAGQSVSLADSGAPNLSVTLSANGNQARNLGELNAAGGRIDIYGALVDQQGIVRADSSGVDAQGRIVLKASGQATLSGTLSAASADGVGGTVQVLGDQVTLSDAARIDASGALGGGTVLVGGDYQGKNAAVQNASATTVAAGARIDASARERGDGGKVVVWSDGATAYNGVVLARGGASGGDGGLVETSGHTLHNGGKVDTRAPKGRTGNWLLDPGVYCFYSVSASECAGGADSTVDDINNIEDYLATSNATLQATNYISFLPAGGSATIDPAIPAGHTLGVLAPYIEIGRGAVIDTSLVGLSLAASPFYGTTTRTDSNGANLTGSIDIRGMLTSNASQTLSADGIVRVLAQSGQYKAGLDMRSAAGTQTLLASGLLDVGVEGTQAGNDITATISSAGAQIIAADRIAVRGGNGISGSNNMAVISSQASQTISGADIALTGGSAGAAHLVVNGDGATQLVESETLELTAGSGGRINSARLAIEGVNTVQTIRANQSITMTGGGVGGNANGADLYAWGGGTDGKATVQEITTGVLVLKGGATAGSSADDGNFATLTSYGAQKITAASIAVQGGSSQQLVGDGTVSSAQISAGTDQVINTSGALTVTGGTGAGHSIASINSQGNQTITAGSLTVAAGNAGVANSADITSVQSQNLIVGGALALRGGAAGNDNNVGISLTGTTGGKQSVSSASLILKAGDGGVFNRASLTASGVNAVQEVSATQSMDLMAGAGGEGNYAQIRVDGGASQASATQKISGGAIAIKGGVSSSTDDTRGNNASLDSAGAQTVTASSIAMQGGSNSVAVANYGASHAFIGSGAGGQTINVSGDLTLTGGSGVGNVHTNIYTYGNQTITANTISAHAGNTGVNNSIDVSIYRDTSLAPVPNLVQTITANNLLLQAGDAGTSNSARLGINGGGTRQNINVGNLSLTGGAGGSDNRVSISLYDDTAKSTNVQTVKAAAITINGGAGQDNNAAIDSQGMQAIIADGVVLQSGSAGNTTASMYAAVDQAIAVKNTLALSGGSATSGVYNGANLNANGNQSIGAGTLLLTGGASGSNNGADITSNLNQTIAVKSLAMTGGAGGSNNYANINAFGTAAGRIQKIDAGSITLQGGTGTNNSVGINGNNVDIIQQITASEFSVSGGSGSGNRASVQTFRDASTQVVNQTITAGTLSLTGGNGNDNNAYVGGNGNQTIRADNLSMTGGVSGQNTGAAIASGFDQIVVVKNAIVMQGGGGTGVPGMSNAGEASFYGRDQSITAASLSMTGGAAGSQNGATINSDGNQTVAVQKLLVQGGAGGNNNGANISLNNGAGHTQRIIATESMTLRGGADGASNSAGTHANGAGAVQLITTPNLTIAGGSGGSDNWAHLWAADSATTPTAPTQTVTAGAIKLIGGGTLSGAVIGGNASQTIVADTVALQGGTGNSGGASIFAGETQRQDFTVRGAMTLIGGTANGSDTLVGSATTIYGGSQRISADSLALTGGVSGTRNSVSMNAWNDQVIDVKAGFTVRGGAGGSLNRASVNAGTSQVISAQYVLAAGGAGGTRNYATIISSGDLNVGDQTITATNISLSGGAGSRNYAYVYAEGKQAITATQTLALTGDQSGAFANIDGNSQNISANRIELTGGSASRVGLTDGGADSGAYISNYAGTQSINLTGSGSALVITGGNGSGVADSVANIGQYAEGGAQNITINGGGSVVLRGGNGNGIGTLLPESAGQYCAGCVYSNNAAGIYSFGGGNQTLDFTAGGTLNLTGGGNGSGNSALILADLSKGARQTITSSGGAANYPSITLIGGSGGFFNPADGATEANNAAIASSSQTTAAAAGALKTINAKSITLNGGGSATTHGGALLGTGQGDAVINVTGDLVMTGGASSVPLLAATTPSTAYSRDQGAIAAINPDGNLKLSVGGNLLMQGGSGTSSGALIDANSASGKVTLAVAGATRMLAGASSAAILSHTGNATVDPSGGAVVVDLGSDGAFTTSTFASSGKSFRLSGKLTADGANANAPLLSVYSPTSDAPDWKVLGAKDLQAGIYASDSYVNQGEIVTPNGNWLVALGKNAAATADPASVINYDLLAAHGYQWTPTAYDSGNAAEFRFILPGDAPVVELRAADNIANATCVTNAAMCATPGVNNGAVVAAAPATVTYDVQLNVADSTPPAAPSAAKPAASEEGPAGGVATAQVGIGGKRAATREKEEAQAADDKKTTAELKREARVASSEAKADMAAVRKVELAARKDAGAARAAAVAAAKEEAQAKRAEATAQRADADLKLVAGDAAKAEAEVRGAATPVLKMAAQARKADIDARRAGLEAKLADANAKKAEAGARRSEAQAKGADAEAQGTDAGARALAAEAKLAEAARSEALVQAREAKSPQQRAAAERVAEDKRVDATQKQAESRVQLALAEDLRLAASQGKVQADARRAQAQAGALEAQARREESQVQAATARSHQEEAAAQRAVAGGKPEVAKAAQARKAGLDRQVAVQARKAEDRKVAAAAKAEEAKAKQAKADEAALVVAQRDDARRQRALKAFAATATAAMSGDQLAERAALRHAYKTEVFKQALTILAQNGHAADLPVCAGGAVNVCVPAPVQLQAQLRAQVTQGARPPLRLPSAAFLPQIERKVALVIGINNYQDKRITPLDSAVPDADAVAALMAERMGYEVRVLRDATKADIVNGIAALSRELGPKDSVTVYYAGHGYMTNNAKNGQQGYWIPADASSNNPANWISTGDVGRLLAAIPASQVMLVSDSCYSGTFAKEQQVAAGADASQILARRSVVVMSSGGEEPVADDGVDGHSIFAWSLMQAMRQVDRYDTGARVFDATKSQVTAAYPQVPRYGAAVSAGHASGGDYLFEARSYK
jgi:filamentous hemagglutinin family protein